MFLSLFIVFFFGILGGILFEKIRIPKIIWYIILGILIGPSVFNIVDENLLNISSYLRQIALVIILTRSGLSLDIKTLKEIGRPAILMCFVPACFEILGIVIFGPMLLKISIAEALLLGSVLAAVSPAIVVPRMIKLKENCYGKVNHVPELVMAGSSCDDIFVIVLFYSFKGIVSTGKFDFSSLIPIPTSIILGIGLGLLVGMIYNFFIKKIKISTTIKTILFLTISFGMLALETALKEYISISSLLGIIVFGIVTRKMNSESADELKVKYNNLWSGFEILLFVLVGCATNARLAFSKEGAIILGLILIGLVFRSIGVIVSISFTKFTFKERLFIIISYLPKATVQASIGGIALSEGLDCGELVLTAAVISILLTATIGSLLMDSVYKKLLKSAN